MPGAARASSPQSRRECATSTGLSHSVYPAALCNVSPNFEEPFSKPQAELNTSFLTIDSVTVAGQSLEGAGRAPPAPRALEHQRSAPGLPWVLVWAQMADAGRANRPCLGEHIRHPPPHGSSLMCRFAKAACFVETNTFWLFGALCSQRESEAETRSVL